MSSRWPWWVNSRYAKRFGRTPDEFDHWQWPVSNVRLEHPEYGMPDEVVLGYHCEIPASTPQANQYDAQGSLIPDPFGLALSRVRFELRAVSDDAVLDKRSVMHENGKVESVGATVGIPLWRRLHPGHSIQVRLYALPFFYFLNESGGAMSAFANMGQRGYFVGNECESESSYILKLTDDGELLIDGVSAPKPTYEASETPEELEMRAQMERERQEAERERREAAERIRKQEEEIKAAKSEIYSRRDNYDTAENWLLGVLFNKSIDFSIRKRVYLVAKEVGVDIDDARRRRRERKEREAAEKKRRYEEQQKMQAQADNIEMIEGMFEMYGAETKSQKSSLLNRAYSHPRFTKYIPAIEIVADRLGIPLAR